MLISIIKRRFSWRTKPAGWCKAPWTCSSCEPLRSNPCTGTELRCASSRSAGGVSRQSGIVVSRLPPPGARGMDQAGVAAHGEQSARQVLHPHGAGAQATESRNRGVGKTDRGDHANHGGVVKKGVRCQVSGFETVCIDRQLTIAVRGLATCPATPSIDNRQSKIGGNVEGWRLKIETRSRVVFNRQSKIGN